MLERGVAEWNKWRVESPAAVPCLRRANFSEASLAGVDLTGADLRVIDLSGAKEFDELMTRRDVARSASFTPPERFFTKARAKIEAGHYDFVVDSRTPTLPKLAGH